MLSVAGLRKEFSTVVAVDDVTFRVPRGSIFGLIGPNGAGKSTTIRMIMDILQPDRGEIRFDGKSMKAAGRDIAGYLPEERGLYRKSKLIDVICYFAALKGLDRRAAREAARPWLERFGLFAHVKRNIEELSRGNQQKVQFIISVLHRPELLVLDELFSGLDPVNQVLMRDSLIELRADNRVILFSTHQMDHAEKLCDDLVLINRGRVVLEGPPADIKHRHGRNAVHISYRGDGAFLRELPGVLRADVSQNFAELELAADTGTNTLLESILPLLEVSSFARIEPSLQSIFIDTVGMPEPDADAAPPAVAAPTGSTVKDPRVRKAFLSLVGILLLSVVYGIMLIRRGHAPDFLGAVIFAGLALAAYKFLSMQNRVRKELRSAANQDPGEAP